MLHAAHRAVESLTLDRGAAHLKDELMPRYAELIYNGYWFAPEREMLQALIDKSQENVNGTVRLKLYKGNVIVEGRKSPDSLYSQEHVSGSARLKLYKGAVHVVGRRSALSLYSLEHVTFEEDSVFDQRDAEGFIKLNALRLRLRLLNRQRDG